MFGFKEKLERDNYLKAVCQEFSISREGMEQMVSRLGNKEGIISRDDNKPKASSQPKKKKEDGVRQAEKILLTWIIDDEEVFHKVAKYIQPKDFIDPLLRDVAEKLYAQFEQGRVNPAAIINTYETEEEHSEIAALFSADLSDQLSKMEREKALNETVIKVKKNSLDNALNNTVDPRQMQDIITQQVKLNQINIQL